MCMSSGVMRKLYSISTARLGLQACEKTTAFHAPEITDLEKTLFNELKGLCAAWEKIHGKA